jgi:hypothetical protein
VTALMSQSSHASDAPSVAQLVRAVVAYTISAGVNERTGRSLWLELEELALARAQLAVLEACRASEFIVPMRVSETELVGAAQLLGSKMLQEVMLLEGVCCLALHDGGDPRQLLVVGPQQRPVTVGELATLVWRSVDQTRLRGRILLQFGFNPRFGPFLAAERQRPTL